MLICLILIDYNNHYNQEVSISYFFYFVVCVSRVFYVRNYYLNSQINLIWGQSDNLTQIGLKSNIPTGTNCLH